MALPIYLLPVEMYLQKMHDYDKELTDISILKSTIAELENFIKNPTLKKQIFLL